jgi:hypothetical protein
MNNETNSLLPIQLYYDFLAHNITMHADCLCKPEGVVGVGISIVDAEWNFWKDFHDNHVCYT